MLPRFLLDTHIVVRGLIDTKRLSRSQARLLQALAHRGEAVTLSAMSLLEIAMLFGDGKLRLKCRLDEFFDELQSSPILRVLPLTYEIAMDAAVLGSTLRNPADRAIVATARVHRLRLITSDQRIIDSNLVATVE